MQRDLKQANMNEYFCYRLEYFAQYTTKRGKSDERHKVNVRFKQFSLGSLQVSNPIKVVC